MQEQGDNGEPPPRKKRGLAGCSPEQRREIARRGAQRLHELRRGHYWTCDEARVMGERGGKKSKRGKARTGDEPMT